MSALNTALYLMREHLNRRHGVVSELEQDVETDEQVIIFVRIAVTE